MTHPPRSPDTVQRSRQLERKVTGRPTSDGAGVKLTRVLTPDLQQRLDPFLMLDAFGSDEAADYIAGFPDHPHRGFETVTYMLAGRMLHRDSAGNTGLLQAGDVQWMTAGRGVIHSEIPQQTEGRMEGFQLWLNLPAKDKLCPPWYRDIAQAELPRFQTTDGAEAVLIAGQSHGLTGAVTRPDTAVLYLDLHLPAGSAFSQSLPAAHRAFLYVYRGDIEVQGQALGERQMGILDHPSDANGVQIHSRNGARVLLLAGQPLQEPIVQYGPFVMNHASEIHQAIQDYRDGRLG